MKSEPANFVEEMWRNITLEAKSVIDKEPVLKFFLNQTVLSQKNFETALECRLLNALINNQLPETFLKYHLSQQQRLHRVKAATLDILAIKNRDSGFTSMK